VTSAASVQARTTVVGFDVSAGPIDGAHPALAGSTGASMRPPASVGLCATPASARAPESEPPPALGAFVDSFDDEEHAAAIEASQNAPPAPRAIRILAY
jgi:hypothetical protein